MKIRYYFILLLFLMASCTQLNTKEQQVNHSFENSVWQKFEEIVWDSINIQGNNPKFLQLEMDIESDFRAELISFQLIVESSDGELRNQGFDIKKDDFTISNLDGKKVMSYKLKEAGRFKAKSIYHIELVSLMPHLTTPGIQQISFKFIE
jgi:hypothetical protein